MSDAFGETISTDDSPAPEPVDPHAALLGDPQVEGNEHLLDGIEETDDDDPADREHRTFSSDDIHAPLANSDVQN